MIRKWRPGFCLACVIISTSIGCDFFPSGPDMKGLDRSFEISVQHQHDVLQGHWNEIDIRLNRIPRTFTGFDFTLGYNPVALVFSEASLSEYFADTCGWEYFTYRNDLNDPATEGHISARIRLIGMADIQNGPHQPDIHCIERGSGQTLMTLRFYTSNDRSLECTMYPVRFYWQEAGDNVIILDNGSTVGINRHIYDYDASPLEDYGGAFPGYTGCPDTADFSEIATPTRAVDFINGGFDFVCSDSIGPHYFGPGDISGNGIPCEIVDVLMFDDYFLRGEAVFGSHVEESTEASDINRDGIPLTVADLQYIMNVFTGDAIPYPHFDDSLEVIVQADYTDNTFTLQSSCDSALGLVFVSFFAPDTVAVPVLSDGIDEMDRRYARHGDTLNVLIWSFGGKEISSGIQDILTIASSEPVELLKIEIAGYYARPCRINLVSD